MTIPLAQLTLLPAALSAAIGVCAILYLVGRGRCVKAIPLRRELTLLAAVVALALALGPLDLVADELFAAHMLQHLLLLEVVPALLVLARPGPVVWRALPRRARRAIAWNAVSPATRRAWRAVTLPAVAFAGWSAVMIVWHVPVLYDATLRLPAVHAFEHAGFLAVGLLYWSTLVGMAATRRTGPVTRAAWAVAGMAVGWALAVALALASTPVYAAYAGIAPRPWGISALADQGLAAGIMWVPGSIPMTVVVLACVYQLLGQGHPRQARPLPVTDALRRSTEGGCA